MVGHRHLQTAVVGPLDAAELGVEAEVDALHHADLQKPVAQALVVAAQQLVRAVDDRDLAAELVEDAGELVGDVSAARDQDAPGNGVEMKRLIAGDAELGGSGEGGAGLPSIARQKGENPAIRPVY